MAVFSFYLEAVMTEAAAYLTTAGDTTPHVMGERRKAELTAPPRYVWVPGRTRDSRDTPTRQVIEHRAIFANAEHFHVHCWGGSFAEAWALRNNVLVALRDACKADMKIENGQWIRPAEGWNQAGEVYALEISLVVPVVDGVVSLDALTVPEPSTFLADPSTGAAYSSPDTDTDGELLVTTSAPQP